MAEILHYVGFANEAAFNEDPAPAAGFHIDIASSTLDTPQDTELNFEGGIGRSMRKHRPGYYQPAGNVVYAVDVATLSRFLRYVLGGYAFTTSVLPALRTHECYGTDEIVLPSFCTRVGKDVLEHVFSGCVANSFELAVEDGFAQATLDITTAKDAKAALAAKGDLILADEYPLVFHEVTASISGVDASARITQLGLSIQNNLLADRGRTLGSRYPRRIPAGQRAVSVTATLDFTDTENLERFWGGATGPSDLGATEFAFQVTLDGGADGSVVFDLPRLIWSQTTQQPTGRDEIQQQVTGSAYAGDITLADTLTEVNTEILATIQNAEDDHAI